MSRLFTQLHKIGRCRRHGNTCGFRCDLLAYSLSQVLRHLTRTNKYQLRKKGRGFELCCKTWSPRDVKSGPRMLICEYIDNIHGIIQKSKSATLSSHVVNASIRSRLRTLCNKIAQLHHIHICTPQNPRPPHTPRHPVAGAQLIFETSKSHCQAALGPLSVLVGPPCCGAAAPAWLMRSHTKTRESSAPLPSKPR